MYSGSKVCPDYYIPAEVCLTPLSRANPSQFTLAFNCFLVFCRMNASGIVLTNAFSWIFEMNCDLVRPIEFRYILIKITHMNFIDSHSYIWAEQRLTTVTPMHLSSLLTSSNDISCRVCRWNERAYTRTQGHKHSHDSEKYLL